MGGKDGARLRELSHGFRERYLRYGELTEQVHDWAAAFPELVRVRSIGTTAEDRALWLLTIGPEPDRARPAAWVDGNMHAAELCGSSVALAVAEDVLRLHLMPDEALHGLPAHVRAHLREVLFYVVPRISPDGAERVLTTGRWLRSVPRDARPNRGHARWVPQDIDGDGVSLAMRKRDDAGDMVESREMPGVMLPRTLEDEGPFYRIFPEGLIEPWDGAHIPSPRPLSDNDPDLNRNFPWSWAPEPQQDGAGPFPASEPESRAVVEAAIARPHLYTWLNLHTFGGVHIRPLGHGSDNRMAQDDLAIYRQLEQWAETYTGYPMVSGYEEFTYEPDKPLHGDLSDFAYHQRGCVAWVCELWDLFERIGTERPKRFVERYERLEHEDVLRLARWDAQENRSRVFRPWHEAQHPQLGDVEVGGLDPRVGLWNPPYEKIDEACRGVSAMYLRVAAMTPQLVIARLEVEALGDETHRIALRVENHGYLGTHGLPSAKELPWNEPVYADLIAGDGCAPVPAHDHRRTLGHLDGWGRGRHAGAGLPYQAHSPGSTNAARASWTVRGEGRVTVRVGSCRTGFVERAVDVAGA